MEVGNQLRREIDPGSQVISAFHHDGGGYQGWKGGSQRVLRQSDLLSQAQGKGEAIKPEECAWTGPRLAAATASFFTCGSR
jgi:hypothetical protein